MGHGASSGNAGRGGGRGRGDGGVDGDGRRRGGGGGSGGGGAEEDGVMMPSSSAETKTEGTTTRVGYALTAKKEASLMSEDLLRRASTLGIEFYPLDVREPIATQKGHPFHVVLQKMSGADDAKGWWDEEVVRYAESHPKSRVVGRPELVKRVTNRGTMLDVVDELRVRGARVSKPKQIVLQQGRISTTSTSTTTEEEDGGASAAGRRGDSSSSLMEDDAGGKTNVRIDVDVGVRNALNQIQNAGLKPPFLAKSLVCDGSAHSHRVAIIHDEQGIECLYRGDVAGIKPPCVLQQYVNHGGFLFKVYVVGDVVRVSTRRSLPDFADDVDADVFDDEGAAFGGSSSSPFEGVPRVSRYDPDDDPEQIPAGGRADDAPVKSIANDHFRRLSREEMGTSSSELSESMDALTDGAGLPGSQTLCGTSPRSAYVVQPEPSILREIGLELKSKLNLDIFNFDLIRVKDDPSGELLIVDINYFPGISKMPGFSDAFCQFLLGTADTTTTNTTTTTTTTGGGV